jgi:hypothetical protein
MFPEELKDELRDWEEKFPNLTIRGRPIGKSRELQEREQLRRMVARSIVEDHLWPEAGRKLEKKLVLHHLNHSTDAIHPLNQKDGKKAEEGREKAETKVVGFAKCSSSYPNHP